MLVFLFTDIEGSTRLWEKHRPAMGAVIARHDAILREQIGASSGRITKHTGDGVTAAFEGGEPLACALEAQKRLAAEAWGIVGELRIRIGLHAGEAEWLPGPEAGSGDFFGPPVNCTARVMSAAWGGQILVTRQVTDVSDLPPRASLRDLGQHLLKDVSAPQQIYQLLHPELPRVEFPPPRSLSGQAISQTVAQQGQRIAALEPEAMAASLVSATLLPGVLGDLSLDSPALAGNVGVLCDLGAAALGEFLVGFAARRPEVGAELVQEQMEAELRLGWRGDEPAALALRASASRLLRAVHGVEATMAAAAVEVKDALARGLAELGGTFDEFRWMLGDLQETLAEVRTRQALQLALQREQLELQRQQLVKTNLILQRQQVAAAAPLVSLDADGTAGRDTEPLPPADLSPEDVACPYKGLAVFEAEDAGYFFGREELVAELTARLAGTRFLAVVGPSGSGKSSVVRAGLLPAVWGGALPGSRQWQTLVLTPGAHPLEELAVRVSLLRGIEASALLEALRSRPEALHLAVKQALADEPEGARLLLVVDQFEEIFALCRNAAERRAFLDALLHSVDVDEGRTVVVPTIRADFYGRCADYPELAAQMSDGVLVGPMSPAELREAITRPAVVAGLRLEPGLVETVIGDVAEEPGALPLLSHALLETFGRRRGRTLTLSGYTASGAVAGAIAQTADTLYDSLDPEQQDLARSIFLQLTELGEEGSQDTRRRVSPAELVRSEDEGPRVEALLRTLADARLVTTGGGPVLSGGRGSVLGASEGTVEVAHEALIREWGRLRGWLDASRDDLRAHRRLTAAAAEWVDAGRDDGFLLRGSRLSQFETWVSETGASLSQVERDYIEASVAARAQREAEREQERAARARAEEQARRSRRLRRLAVGLAAVLVLAVAAGVYALIQRNESQRLLRLSVSHRLTAASISSLEAYPERSVLLALEAVAATYAKDNSATREADAALRRALEALRLQRTLFGHGGPVYAVAVSPDGTCLATAGADRTARVWDATSGEELYALSGHTSLVRAVAFGPATAGSGRCGASLVTASDDGTARVWSLASGAPAPGEELLTLSGHGGRLTSAAFSPDGSRLATASEDGTAKIWDAATGQELLTLAGHAGPVHGIAFSPDGTRLATASEDGTAREWSLPSSAGPSGRDLLSLSGHAGPVYAVVFSLDGSRLATAGADGTARVWDSTTGEEMITISGHNGTVRGVAFAPDGTGLATAGEDETAKVWSLGSGAGAQGQDLLTLFGHTGPVYGVAFSPDGMRLATASEDRTARVWNISATQGWLSLSGHTESVWSAAFSPDGKCLATASGDGTAKVWDAASGRELLTLSGHTDEVNVIAFDPDGTRLATASLDGTARVWDAASGQELRTLNGHNDWVVDVAFSPDGTRLATASHDGTAKVWDAASGREMLTLTGHNGWVKKVAFSPDGARLATASQDGTGRVWDASSGRELLTLAGRAGAVFGIGFSPDGARVATAHEDGTGRLWDVASGQELLSLSGHSDWALDIAYSPDATRLATASADGTARVWDAASGRELLSFSGDADMVNAVAFSPDGARLVAASTDGVARIYVLDTEELVSLACSRVTRNLTEAEWQTYLGQDVAYRRTCPNLPVPPAWLTYGHID